MTGKFICGISVIEYEKIKHDAIEEAIRYSGHKDDLSFFDFTDNTEEDDRQLDRLYKQNPRLFRNFSIRNYWFETVNDQIFNMECEGEIECR